MQAKLHRPRGARTTIALAATLALVAAGCGEEPVTAEDPIDDEVQPTESPEEQDAPEDEVEEEAPAEPAPEEADLAQSDALLSVASTDLGEILVTGEGMTVYLFEPDEQVRNLLLAGETGEPTCEGDCTDVWPVVEGPLEAGDGVDEALLDTVERSDGLVQATYDGWPLYLFVDDQEPGQTAGQGQNDIWWVMDAAGEAVGTSGGDMGADEGNDGESEGGGYGY